MEVTRYVENVPPPTAIEWKSTAGALIELAGVTVVAGGHTVLSGIDLTIPAGQHIAIVGPSGSGKSTLVALLLGGYRPSEGELRIDGQVLDQSNLADLRRRTVWIDPAVQLWNDTLLHNLEYAARGVPRRPMLNVLEDSDLLDVLAGLERGLETPIGAEGAFVSGGEGQRLRIGRALLRAEARLAILDEPFRGLEREVRARLLDRTRRALKRATMMFVSHDISQTLTFDRVLVVRDGHIVEDGVPSVLAASDTYYANMLSWEKRLRDEAWGSSDWRRLRIQHGTIVEGT
jgi:ATP-binding cassette subfamily B protein